jgi:hypothetical protein
MATAEGYVLPKPGIPKTLGILNIIFGVILVILSCVGLGMLAIAPALLSFAESKGKEVQAKVEDQEKARLKEIDDRLAKATTDEEKKAIEQERSAAAANQLKFNPMDMSAATEVLTNPTIKVVNIGGAATGLILHVVLLISGIGLIRLTPWGRSLALWWSALIIVQVVALLIATLVVVVPVNTASTERQIAKYEAQVKAGGQAGQVAQTMLQATKFGAMMVVPSAVGQAVSGLIYPIVLLILLNNAGARAACLAKKPEGLESF